MYDWDGSEETKPRELLQKLGTDVIRNKLDKAEMFIKRQVDDIEIYSLEDNENDLISLRKEYDRDFAKNKNKLNLKFKGFENKPFEDELFNNFINKVMGQVDYCSKTKNSSLMMLGIRDIAQMLEAMVMWNPKYVREKIVYVLYTIGISGRSARQISFFNEQGEMFCDDREFIDQGQWLISLVHKYICYTNDISVLKEKCGYVSFIWS